MSEDKTSSAETVRPEHGFIHQALNATQNGYNYLAPLREHLEGGGKALHTSCCDDSWTMEMALEFTAAEWATMDIGYTRGEGGDFPKNVQSIRSDPNQRLPFPDHAFDLVHTRFTSLKVTNWKALVDGIIRVTKPGGMICLVEPSFPWTLIDVPERQWKDRAPGFHAYQDYLVEVMSSKGLYPLAGSRTIAGLLRASGAVGEVVQLEMPLPLWSWSEESNLSAAGTLMQAHAQDWINFIETHISDSHKSGSGDSKSHEDLVRGYLLDLGREGCTSAVPITHNYCWKI